MSISEQAQKDAARFPKQAARDGVDISAEIVQAIAAAETARDADHAFYWALVNALRARSGLKPHQEVDMAITTADVGRDHALQELDRVRGL